MDKNKNTNEPKESMGKIATLASNAIGSFNNAHLEAAMGEENLLPSGCVTNILRAEPSNGKGAVIVLN